MMPCAYFPPWQMASVGADFCFAALCASVRPSFLQFQDVLGGSSASGSLRVAAVEPQGFLAFASAYDLYNTAVFNDQVGRQSQPEARRTRGGGRCAPSLRPCPYRVGLSPAAHADAYARSALLRADAPVPSSLW